MKNRKKNENIQTVVSMKAATNLVLGVLVLSVGALCLSSADGVIETKGETTSIYRQAGENAKGISLMFNVYWGTEEVYRILEILEKYDAKATFFIGGCWADDNVECLRAIYNAGHELGNHGYFHKDHSKLNREQNQKEISSCNRFVELSTMYKPVLFAPPSGAYGEDMLFVCETLKMKTILWSRDTVDWRDKDASIIYTRATKNIKNGEFVLMHPMSATADALEDILKYYKTLSFDLVTVSENLREKG